MHVDVNEVDDLTDFIAECAQDDPDFPALVEAALQRRLAMRARGEDPNEEESSTDPEATAISHPALSETAAVHD
ncbi:MAG TPA: hypothetical protein VMV29_17135 [Ktedonobacterales bacterium]|nr:hypothetical protein [Ktedonobacterales bacterium]